MSIIVQTLYDFQEGKTALHHACYSGKQEIVKLLLEHQPTLIDWTDTVRVY